MRANEFSSCASQKVFYSNAMKDSMFPYLFANDDEHAQSQTSGHHRISTLLSKYSQNIFCFIATNTFFYYEEFGHCYANPNKLITTGPL